MKTAMEAIRWALAEWVPSTPNSAVLVLELGERARVCADRGCRACASRWTVAPRKGTERTYWRAYRDGLPLRRNGRVRSFWTLDRAQAACLAQGFLECRCGR